MPCEARTANHRQSRLESHPAMGCTEGANPLQVQRVNLSGTEDRGSGNLNHGFGLLCIP